MICITMAISSYACLLYCSIMNNLLMCLKVLEEEKLDVEETCDGIGEEECLMRRTLVAHTDYIYTQKHKP